MSYIIHPLPFHWTTKRSVAFNDTSQIGQDRSDALEQTEQEFFEVPGASREKEIKHMCLADRTAGFKKPLKTKRYSAGSGKFHLPNIIFSGLLLLVLGCFGRDRK